MTARILPFVPPRPRPQLHPAVALWWAWAFAWVDYCEAVTRPACVVVEMRRRG